MQRATRLIQPLSRAIRPCSRSALLPTIPHAGPSTLSRRYISSSSSLSQSLYSTSQSNIKPDSPFSSRRNDKSQEETAATSSDDADVLQELEDLSRDQIDESLKFIAPPFHAPVAPGQPIILPLSNLAESPAEPSSDGLAITLSPEIWAERMRRDILHRCVVWYRASMRQGTHKTKGRSEVAYSGRKLRAQKKTGKARLGDASSPHLRGGADAHPKRPRDYSYPLPRKVRALGMRTALSSKLSMGLLRVVQTLNSAGWQKTKEAEAGLRDGPGWVPDPDYVLEAEGVKGIEGSAETPVDTVVEAIPESASGEASSSASSTIAAEAESSQSAVDFSEAVKADARNDSDFTEKPEFVAPEEDPVDTAGWKLVDKVGFASQIKSKEKLSILFLHAPSKPAAEIWDFARPLRNIPGIEIMSTDEVEVYHILKYRWLVMEGDAVDAISKYKGQVEVDHDRLATIMADELEDPEVVAEELKTEEAPITAQENLTSANSELGDLETTEFPVPLTGKERKAAGLPRLPRYWITEKWRKVRGVKSMRKTFGTKNATAAQNLAKIAKRRIQKTGRKPTPDLVAQYITKRKSTIAVPL